MLVTGTTGADALYGGAGADTINGLTGPDVLDGGAGADVYLYAQGDGADTLTDYSSTGGEVDTLKFTDVNGAGVQVSQSGYNLLVTVKATGHTTTVQNHFWSTDYGIEKIEFSDSSFWTRSQIATLVANASTSGTGAPVFGTSGDDSLSGASTSEHLFGDSGNDTIDAGANSDGLFGGSGADVLVAGAGADLLYGNDGTDTLNGGTEGDVLDGGAGADVYLYAQGDGADTLSDYSATGSEVDALQFTDINGAGVQVSQSSSNLLITVKATGHTITVQNHFYSSNYGIEKIEFSDSSFWTRSQIATLVANASTSGTGAPVFGTSGDDSLSGASTSEHLFGDSGNDTIDAGANSDGLFGGSGADVLIAGAGADLLYGGDGTDTLNGGTDGDIIDGGVGADVYLYAQGDGADQIVDYSTGSGEVDILRFTDVASTGVTLSQSGGSLAVTVTATSQVFYVQHHFLASSYGIERIEFSDAVVLTRGVDGWFT